MIDSQKIIIILILVCVVLLVLRLNGEFFQLEPSIRSDQIVSLQIDEVDPDLTFDSNTNNDTSFDTVTGRVTLSDAYFTRPEIVKINL